METLLEEPEKIPAFEQISPDQRSITDDGRWKTFFLYGFGIRAEANCDLLPNTARLVEQVPGMMTAFFSILLPGKHISEHRGLYKGFLRYHLGLKVPDSDRCWIRVGSETRHWKEGQSLLFDDTFQHEVRNDTDEVRVVLFLDVVRPLRFPVSLLNEAVIRLIRRTGYVQVARQNFESWERTVVAEKDWSAQG